MIKFKGFVFLTDFIVFNFEFFAVTAFFSERVLSSVNTFAVLFLFLEGLRMEVSLSYGFFNYIPFV